MQNISNLKKSGMTQRRQFNSTFESDKSVEQKEEKFSIRKELYRGIKDNDVEKIAGKPDDKETDTNFIYNEYEEVHRLLTEMRKSHDEVKTVTNSKKNQIELDKKVLEELRSEQAQLDAAIKAAKKVRQSATQELQDAEDRLKRQMEGYENSAYTRDVYLNIQDTIKHDNIIMKKRIFDTQLELSKCRTRFRSTLNDATSKRKIDQQCQKMLESMERVVEFEKQKRMHNINSIEEVIQRKNDSFLKRAQREKDIEKVVISALNEKSPQQKQWSKLLLSNKLLSAILRSKIQRQLAKHQEVEKAFHNIKLNTGVTQSDVFVEKYLNREQTYGELLNSISEKQPRLEKEQQLNEQLKQRERELLELRQTLQPAQKSSNPELNRTAKEIEQLNGKLVNFERQREAFYQWAVKFLKRYDNLTDTSKKRNSMNYYEFYPRSDLVTIYKKIAAIINKNLDEVAPKEEMVQAVLMKNSMREPTLNDKYLQRNTRIRTQAFDPTERQDDIDHIEDITESEYLQDYRRTLKKDNRNNRRFRIKTKPN